MTERTPIDQTGVYRPVGEWPDRDDSGAFRVEGGLPSPPEASVLLALGACLPVLPRVQLRDPEGEPRAPEVAASSQQRSSQQVPASRLRLDGEIARGGMGAVLKGHDTDLGRDIAVKVLLEAHQGKTELLQRFIEEAQIAGQLQHPGVVPVYELGRFPDNRPYFTMKLVKGQTLARLLAQRGDLGQDRLRFLKVFEQVCQTLAYAHARGVIHRDLKPSNIMVGSFGEVQVMDWGLAKVLPSSAGADDRTGREPQPAEQGSIPGTRVSQALEEPGSTGRQTYAGSVLGTPAYMPPEQARGQVERLDTRCDVFGLGAILCEILTGQPPYVGTNHTHVYGKASRADLADALARLRASGADAELTGLAERCLAPEAQDRPRNAGAVAAAVSAHLESVDRRLREAELSRARATARTEEERKRRRVTLALAGSVLLTVVLGGVGWRWVELDRQQRLARTNQQIKDALVEVSRLHEQARGQITDPLPWAQTQEAAKRAETLLDSAGVDPTLAEQVRAMLAELAEEQADRRLVARMSEARLVPSEPGRPSFSAQQCLPVYEAAFRGYGFEVGQTDPQRVADRIRSRPASIHDAVVSELDNWILITEWFPQRPSHLQWLRAVVRDADPDPWRTRLREAAARKDRQALEQLARDPAVLQQWPATLTVLAHSLRAHGAPDAAVDLLRRAQRQYPSDFWINSDLARHLTLLMEPQWEDAIRFHSVALALRENAFSRGNLAQALTLAGRPDEAAAVLGRTTGWQQDNARAHGQRGSMLLEQGQWEAGVSAWALAIRSDPTTGATLWQTDPEAAVAAYGRATELAPQVHDLWRWYSGVTLLAGNETRYRHCRREMLRRFAHTRDPLIAERTAKACLLLDGSAEELSQAAALADRALAGATPGWAVPYFEFAKGLAEYRQGRLEGACRWLDRALSHPSGHWTLTVPAHLVRALACYRRGQTDEARRSLAEADRLYLQGKPAWNDDDFICRVLRSQAETLIELEPELKAIRKGEIRVTSAVAQLTLARKCVRSRRYYLAAARFFADAFAADPKLADDPRAGNSYNAACCAALAAAGQGEDAPKLDGKERARWRKQALDWLRADLARWAKRLESDRAANRLAVQQQLRHWLRDPDLAGLRDQQMLANLPADEQAACHQLWDEVAALLKKVQEKSK